VEVIIYAQALKLVLNQKHRTNLGLLYLIVGIVEFLLALIAVAVIIYIGVIWSFDPGHHNDPFHTFLIALLLVALLVYPVPSVIAGYGLWKEKNWFIIWTWIATGLHLLNIPFGTLIGAYGLWVLLRKNHI